MKNNYMFDAKVKLFCKKIKIVNKFFGVMKKKGKTVMAKKV